MMTVTWRGHVLGVLAQTLAPTPRWVRAYQPRSVPGTPRPPMRQIHGSIEQGDDGLRLVISDRCPLEDATAVSGIRGWMPSEEFAALVRGARKPITIERRASREARRLATSMDASKKGWRTRKRMVSARDAKKPKN